MTFGLVFSRNMHTYTETLKSLWITAFLPFENSWFGFHSPAACRIRAPVTRGHFVVSSLVHSSAHIWPHCITTPSTHSRCFTLASPRDNWSVLPLWACSVLWGHAQPFRQVLLLNSTNCWQDFCPLCCWGPAMGTTNKMQMFHVWYEIQTLVILSR